MAANDFEPPPSTRYVAIVNGAPANPISGTRPPSSSADQAHRLEDERRRLRASGTRSEATSRRAADRMRELRRRVELDVHAHARQRDEDVGEEDGRVDAEPRDRLQRDLGRQLRRAAAFQEIVALADRAVLRQVAARPAA